MFTKKFCILFTKEDKFKIVHVGPFKLMSMLYKFVQAIALIKVSKSIIFRCASFNKYFFQKVVGLQWCQLTMKLVNFSSDWRADSPQLWRVLSNWKRFLIGNEIRWFFSYVMGKYSNNLFKNSNDFPAKMCLVVWV